ncbi:MAG: energy transducer TonB [Asticcacaulis sp.]
MLWFRPNTERDAMFEAALPVTRNIVTEVKQPSLTPMMLDQRHKARSRWGAGLSCAVAFHIVPLMMVAYWKVSTPDPMLFEEPSIAVEMVHLQAPPEPPSEQPEGPKQVEAAASKARPKPVERIITRTLPTDVEPIAAPPPVPEVSPTVDATPAPETTAPLSRPAPPAPSASSSPQSWQTRLMSHLEKNKRYPADARSRRQQGVVWLRFSMDRDGRVVTSEVDRSSGYAALDREALNMLRRSVPLPKPPEDVTGNPIEITVPVEFFIR